MGKEDTKIQQHIIKRFEYLTKIKKFKYKEKNIKSDRIIMFINDTIMRCLKLESSEINLMSSILQQKYGHEYKRIIEYLEENHFLAMICNYCVGKKSKTYRIFFDRADIISCYITDKVVLNGLKKSENLVSIIKRDRSTIDPLIRNSMTAFLTDVKLNYADSLDHLNKLYEENKIGENKYILNVDSIERINSNRLFLKFDEYGRMHTNFTTLKKEIRSNNLTIDGSKITEIDIKNSQPFFFSILIKNEFGYSNLNKECKLFCDLCKKGTIYDYILKHTNDYCTRKEIKIMMYVVLFGSNNLKKKENEIFNNLFPTIFSYIKEFKSITGDYKELSHRLQTLESNFIFNTVIKKVLSKYPHIKMITVHDSIMFPVKYEEEVRSIFDKELSKLIK